MIPTKSDIVSTIEGLESKEFSIQVTDKSFKILLDGLYTNKPKSIIRELWSNAYDSHIDAGIADKPFHCQLPGPLDLNFVVRDYGTSMTHDQVMNLYSTVFASTKTETNDQTGMLGLGSKSPFSYTDAFSVIAYSGTEKRTYLASLNESGIPLITLLKTERSGEPRGFEVGFTVHHGDWHHFEQAAREVLVGFDTAPTIAGNIIQTPELLFEAEGVRILSHGSGNSYRASYYVRQGPVVYPISWNPAARTKIAGANEVSFIVDVPMGSVDFTASREALQENERTVDAVRDIYEQVLDGLENLIVTDIESQPTLRKAKDAYRSWTKSFTIDRSLEIHWGEHEINEFSCQFVDMEANGPVPGLLLSVNRTGRKTLNNSYDGSKGKPLRLQHNELEGLTLIIDDGTKVPRSLMRMREYAGNRRSAKTLVLKNTSVDAIIRMMRIFGLSREQFIYLKDLPDVATSYGSNGGAGSSSRAKGAIPGVRQLNFNQSGAMTHMTSEVMELPDKYYWVRVDSTRPSETVWISYLGVNSRLDEGYNWSYTLPADLGFEVRPVVLFTDRPFRKYQPNESDNFNELVHAYMKDHVQDVADKLKSSLELYRSGYDPTMERLMRNKLKDTGYSGRAFSLARNFLMMTDELLWRSIRDEAQEVTAHVYETYPMLARNPSDEDMDAYIEMVDRHNESKEDDE